MIYTFFIFIFIFNLYIYLYIYIYYYYRTVSMDKNEVIPSSVGKITQVKKL